MFINTMEVATRNAFVRQRRLNAYYVNPFHKCNANCILVNPFTDGCHFVCMESLQYHYCCGGKACILGNIDNQSVCLLTGHCTTQEVYVGVDRPLYDSVPIAYNSSVRAQRDCQSSSNLMDTVCPLILKLYDSENRKRYNNTARIRTMFVKKVAMEIKSDILRNNASMINAWNKGLKRSVLLRTHFYFSELLSLESYVKKVMEIIFKQTTRRREMLYNNPEATIIYVTKCILDGFQDKEGRQILSSNYAHMGPMPMDRHFKSIFAINDRKLTQCSKILHRTITTPACMRSLTHLLNSEF